MRWRAKPRHLPGEVVGVDDDGALGLEQAGDGGLAGADAPGQAHQKQDGRPYHWPARADPLLYSPRAEERLGAAQSQGRRARRALADRTRDWPPYSPGALNAWLLLVTTKPPSWRDPIVLWPEAPLTLGAAHEGFFYPDPLGFWAEVRRWALELFRAQGPTWGTPEALALTTLLHVGDQAERFAMARAVCQPRMILFLDEPSFERAGLPPLRREPHFITDPHRKGQVYEGFWAKDGEGVVVGKAPQHPATHNLYRPRDMLGFLRGALAPDGV